MNLKVIPLIPKLDGYEQMGSGVLFHETGSAVIYTSGIHEVHDAQDVLEWPPFRVLNLSKKSFSRWVP